ncbi:MAG: fatty acid--CoA ligase family protein [Gammaproteobacteria bacterium]
MAYFLDKIRATPDHVAFQSDTERATHQQLSEKIAFFEQWLTQNEVGPGRVVSFDGDYSLESIALFLALTNNRNIVVPLSLDSHHHFEEFRHIACTEFDISLNTPAQNGLNAPSDTESGSSVSGPRLTHTGRCSDQTLYQELRKENAPGLVLFSSGSTGKSKAIVQNLNKLMSKFSVPRPSLRMLIFLQLDHIGGVNSLLYALANQGTVIKAEGRTPELVCAAIERHRAELLPTSPTFLNLILLSKAYEHHDLSSLKVITYGTEPMQESTLHRLQTCLPTVRLQQTYGLSEVGILRSKSRGDGSLWMKIGGDEFDVKITDGTLRIKADSAMLGYLNAPSPFDEDGYMDTGDIVEQDGDWIRILGRASEIINVGGFKVFPAEIESVLLEMDNVEDVVVFGENHPITGKIVTAQFKLIEPETTRSLKGRMMIYCKDKLPSYKTPSKISITDQNSYNERFKRMRRRDSATH